MANRKLIRYIHRWGLKSREVAAFTDLIGEHRAHCLCHSCDKLKLGEVRSDNCPIANKLYAVCVEHDVVTPVFECPNFVERGTKHG